MRVSITNCAWPSGPAALGAELARVARAADEADLDTVWVADRLSTMVTGVTFRPAALLIKSVTTLDVLSGGGAWLGVGAGDQQDEACAKHLPLPPLDA